LKHPTQEALWQEYRRIYCDLALDQLERQERCDAFYKAHEAAMNEGVVETWPEKWSYRRIREKEFESGRPLILREYQNLPVDRAMAWFKMDEAITFEAVREGLRRSDGRLVCWEELSGATIFLDWAGALESREENCYAAVVTVVWEPVEKGRYDDLMTAPAYGYVYSANLLRGTRTQQLEAHIQELVKVRSFLSPRANRPDFYLRCEAFVDTTGDMKMNFDREYESLRNEFKFTERVKYVPRIKRKEDRIAALQLPIENGWLCFSTKLTELYMDQMREFPYGEFNDGPDATEGAWSEPVTITMAQHRENRRRWKEEGGDEGPWGGTRRLPHFTVHCS